MNIDIGLNFSEKMALNIDGIEEAIKQSPRRTNVTERGDEDELIDKTADDLRKISDYKSYCKVGKIAEFTVLRHILSP